MSCTPCARIDTSYISHLLHLMLLAAGPGCAQHASSAIRLIGAVYGFAPDIIWAGTGYFKRLAAAGFLIPPASQGNDTGFDALRPVAAVHACLLCTEAWLTLVHLTCIYLAAKYIDFVPYKDMLQTMMGHIYNTSQIKRSDVTNLELECLDALSWQLGTEDTYNHVGARL